MHEPFASEKPTPDAAASDVERRSPTLVDQILDRLDPLITHQRREVARHGCLRMVSSTQLHVLYLLD